MIKTPKVIFSFILSLVLFVAIFWIGYKLLYLIWKAFSEVDPTLGAGIIAACGTIFVSIVSILVSKNIEHKATILNEKKGSEPFILLSSNKWKPFRESKGDAL